MKALAIARPLARELWALPSGESDSPGGRRAPQQRRAAKSEDLPYKVELWTAPKDAVERVLAVTASASIGFAAYYAATREFPDRYVTLRDNSGIISRWNGPTH